MHMTELVSVGQAENGYIISVRVPIRKDQTNTAGCCPEDYERDKLFTVETAEEAGKKIAEILPMLYPLDPEQELQQAFSEAVK